MNKIKLKYKIIFVLTMIEVLFLVLFQLFYNKAKESIQLQIAETQSKTLNVFFTELEEDFIDTDGVIHLYDPEAESMESFAGSLFDVNNNLTSIGFWDPEYSPIAWFYSDSISTTGYEENIQDFSLLCIQDSSCVNSGWKIVLCETLGRYFLLRITYSNDVYLCVLMDLQTLSTTSQTKYDLVLPVLFIKNGEALTTARWLTQYLEDGGILYECDEYRIIRIQDSDYMVVNCDFLTITMHYAVPFKYEWKEWEYMRMLFFALSAGGFITAWMIMMFSVLRPMNRLLTVMKDIRSGNITARASLNTSMEFRIVNETFNDMLDQISSLKIESYERRIQADTSRMNALRLQIRRHYFLNCLKSIYGMTVTGDIPDIQQMVMHLSTYLRYTLDIEENTVDLEKELDMCRNYVELQGIGQPIKPGIRIQMTPGLSNFQIPQLSLLTLLENSFKYGNVSPTGLQLTVRAEEKKFSDSEFVLLEIADNGPGFSEEYMDMLNNDTEKLRKGGHVGISNVMERMHMVYGEGCSFWFGNAGGACIMITLPKEIPHDQPDNCR